MKKLFSYISYSIYHFYLIIVTVCCVTIYICARFSEPFAELFSRYIAGYIRYALGVITSVIPFSLAEILILCIPIAVILFIFSLLMLIFAKNQRDKYMKRTLALFSVIPIVFNLFVFTYGTCYFRTPLNKAVNISDSDIDAQDLKSAAIILVKDLNYLTGKISFDENSISNSQRSFRGLSKDVLDAFNSYYATHSDYLSPAAFLPKSIMLSRALTYTHTSGIYTYFTGETNINTNYPEYIQTVTIAHEFCHQRGIAAENEASAAAFIILYESNLDYLKYCASADMLSDIGSALLQSSPEAYLDVMSKLDKKVIGEWVAYSEFFDEYRENKAQKIYSSFNDAYLKSQGQQDGVATYSQAVNLCVNYLLGKQ